jgi:hypothetical protein
MKLLYTSLKRLVVAVFLLAGLYACQLNSEAPAPAVPKLKPVARNIMLGDQGSAVGSFYSSSANEALPAVEIAALTPTEKNRIDITFASIYTEREPAFVSPDAREQTSGYDGSALNNPMGAYATRTVFKEVPGGPADLSKVSAAEVAAINGNDAVKVIVLRTNTTYAFVNAQGKKGFIRVRQIGDLDGQGNAGREVVFDVVVQE